MGRPKKIKETIEEPVEVSEPDPVEEAINAEKEKEENKVESDVLKNDPPPLQPGQKYFETPDGELIIGEASKQQVWSRKLNNGRGGWVNPKR